MCRSSSAADDFLSTLAPLVAAGRIHARPPSADVTLPDELDILDWTLPPWWQHIRAVHDGLGPWWGAAGCGRPTLLPLDEVRPLTAFIRFGEENITFDPADALLLTPDAAGGGIVLADRDAPVLRVFDGQRHRLGRALPIQAYLNGLITAWTAQEDLGVWPWL